MRRSLTAALLLGLVLGSQSANAQDTQLAVVLDVSGSVGGFTNLARQKVKQFILERAPKGQDGSLQLALYVYGVKDDGEQAIVTSVSNGFTTKAEEVLAKIDEIFNDENLSGGNEGPGKVLQAAEDQLQWRPEADTRQILIVGNESFDQGSPNGTSRAQVLPRHTEPAQVGNRIIQIPAPIALYTIFCGPKPEAKRDNWEKAAQVGGGKFDYVDPSIN